MLMMRDCHISETDQRGKERQRKQKQKKDGIDAALKEGIRSKQGGGARTGEPKRVDVAPLLS
jgi:hypothetical protein